MATVCAEKSKSQVEISVIQAAAASLGYKFTTTIYRVANCHPYFSHSLELKYRSMVVCMLVVLPCFIFIGLRVFMYIANVVLY